MNRSDRIEIQRHLQSGLDIRDVPYLVRVKPAKPPEAVWCNGRLIIGVSRKRLRALHLFYRFRFAGI